MKSYRPEELFDAEGRLKPELAELAPKGHRRMSDNPHANGGLLLRDLKMPDFRDYAVEVPSPGATTAESARDDGQVPPRRHEAEPGQQELPPVQPGREQLEPLAGRAGGDRPLLHGRDLPGGRQAQPRRPGDGGAQRAPVPGLAGGLPADRPARLLLLLRGVHPHHRLDVQPARQVAEGVQPHPLAAADRLVQLLPQLARLAAGPQRLQPPGPRLHRPRRQQEGRGDPRLPAAGRQLPAVGDRPLPAQPQLRQRRRRRQAAGAAVADDGPGGQALHRGPRHLGVGQQRQGQRAGRGHGLLRRRADAGDAGGGRADAQAPAGAEGARGQRREPDEAAAGERAPARAVGPRLRRPVHQGQADHLRLPRLPVADPPADLPADEPQEPARPRLQGRGHDDDAVRHGGAQRPRPLPPGART